MSKRTAADYLQDMLTELNDIAAFTVEGRSSLMNDVRTRKAVIRSYEIVGEIAKRLPADVRDANPQIDWRQLINFRDFLAHHYETVILENIWAAIQDLPNLKAAVENILASFDADGEEAKTDE